MQVRIRNGASEDRMNGSMTSRLLSRIEGSYVDVDTTRLYSDQFDITNALIGRMRVLASDVDDIIDDKRIGKVKCLLCGKLYGQSQHCPRCGSNSCKSLIEGYGPTMETKIKSVLSRCFPIEDDESVRF